MGEESYTAKVGCTNCLTFGRLRIRHEVTVDLVKCPNCRTRSLEHVLWVWPWQRRFRKNERAVIV